MRLTKLPLIKPVIRLMNSLPFVRKFILVSVFFSLPLIILGSALFIEINKSISVSKEEQKGVRLLGDAYSLLFLAHDYRDTRMIQRARAGADTAKKVDDISQSIDLAIKSLKQSISVQGNPDIYERASKLSEKWDKMKPLSAGAQGGPNIQFQFYNGIVKDFEYFLKSIAYESKLIHDSEMDVFLLVNILMQSIPATLDNMGYSRGYGVYALNLNAIDYETFKTFDKIYDDLSTNHDLLQQNLMFTLHENKDSQLKEVFQKIESHSSNASDYFYTHLIEKDFITEKWGSYYAALSDSFIGIQDAINTIIPVIDHKLAQRIQNEQIKLWGISISSLVLVFVIFYLYSGMYISIALVSKNFTKQAKKVASGDLSVSLDVRSNDELSQLYIAFNDMVRQLKENQKQILQAEKMASLGSMIAGVAHEMNTPLGIGITAVSKLKEDIKWIDNKYQKDSMKRSDLEDYINHGYEGLSLIQANMQRCSKLINSFKQLSVTKTNVAQTSIDIIPIIQNVISPTGILNIPQSIEINLEASNEVIVNIDPDLLSLIFVNIISNILQHAFPKQSGKIHVKIEKSQGRLLLDISDDGIGISNEDIEQIFEPFYTTRRNQGYVGLGLHIVYVILTQALHGTIKVESSPNNGAHFKIEIAEFNPDCIQKH